MSIERQVTFWLAALAVFAVLLWLLGAALMPVVAGMALAYLLDPVADWLERLGMSRMLASLFILTICLLLFVLMLVAIVPVLAHQLGNLIENLPGLIAKLQKLMSEQSGVLSQKLRSAFEAMGFKLDLSAGASSPQVGAIVKEASNWLTAVLSSIWSGGQTVFSLVSLLVITPVVAFYMLVDWDRMIGNIDANVPPQYRQTVRRLASEIDRSIAGFVRGQSAICLFLGLWYGIFFTLIGLNFGFLIGITAGVLSFIPYVGTMTALLAGTIVALVQGWPSLTLLVLVLVIHVIAQFLEGNVLQPKWVGKAVGLHPVWVIVALIVFGYLFGFTGLLIAVPVAAAIAVLFRFGLERYRESNLYHTPDAEIGE